MTLDEIQKMSDRQVNAAIAEKVEWPHLPGRGWRVREGSFYYYDPTISLDACHAAEQRLGKMGAGVDVLTAIESVLRQDGEPCNMDWCKYSATARQRAEAILLAVQDQEAH